MLSSEMLTTSRFSAPMAVPCEANWTDELSVKGCDGCYGLLKGLVCNGKNVDQHWEGL